MSVLQVDTIQDSAGTTNKELAQYSSGNWSWGTGVPADTIIQIKSATFNGYQSIGTSIADVTNLSCSMTIASGNKVLIFVNLYAGQNQDSYGIFHITDGSNNIIIKNTTGTGSIQNASMSISAYNINNDIHTVKNQSLNYLWTPGVTSITVKVRGQVTYPNSGGNLYINGTHNTGNYGYNTRTVSNLTIMEVQA